MKTALGHGSHSTWTQTADGWMDKFGDWFVPIPETGCWIWMKALTEFGYGKTTYRGRNSKAHRISYQLLRGPIPAGLQIDHLCRVRSCVNPDHLEVVTPQTNSLRGIGPSAIHAKQTHCIRGHEFTPENTGYYQRDCPRQRRCMECQRMRARSYRLRIRAARLLVVE